MHIDFRAHITRYCHSYFFYENIHSAFDLHSQNSNSDRQSKASILYTIFASLHSVINDMVDVYGVCVSNRRLY